MKKLVALAAATAGLLSACQDPVDPLATGLPDPGRPLFDHTTYSFAIASHVCWDSGVSWYSFYQCAIYVNHGDGTGRYYGNGTPLVFYEDGSASGIPSWLLRPTWSPDASKIAADNDSDIVVIRLADSSFSTLTNHPARDHSPAWSPDGAQIAFISERDGVSSLYLMRATDGGGLTRLTSGVEVSFPTWSPDATRLAFTCTVESGNSDICAVNADGSGFARLTSAPGWDFHPDWSPDGARIVFVTNRFTAGSSDIATMAPDGTNVTKISQVTSGSLYYASPDWSPDGTRIIYSKASAQPSVCEASGSCYVEPSAFVMNVDGSSVGVVAASQFPKWRPGSVYPPATDEPPVAHVTYTCTYLECYLYGYSSTDDHGIKSYRWDTGDARTNYNYDSPFSVIFHRYAAQGTYQVTLTVKDYDGHSASTTQTVTVQSRVPVASFSWSCGAARACSFNSSASNDDDGIVSRTWLFGDGSSLNDVVAPSHTYSAPGSYDVTLTVRDAAGQSNSVMQTVTALADNAPVARFTYFCSTGTCVFDGNSSTDDWGIVSYRWEIGRQVYTGALATVSFKGRPTVTVTLTVTDQAGQTNTTTQTVNLK